MKVSLFDLTEVDKVERTVYPPPARGPIVVYPDPADGTPWWLTYPPNAPRLNAARPMDATVILRGLVDCYDNLPATGRDYWNYELLDEWLPAARAYLEATE